MKSLTLFIVLTMLPVTLPLHAAAPEPGVALTLARERAAQVSHLRYEFDASLDAGATALQGRLSIRFD